MGREEQCKHYKTNRKTRSSTAKTGEIWVLEQCEMTKVCAVWRTQTINFFFELNVVITYFVS